MTVPRPRRPLLGAALCAAAGAAAGAAAPACGAFAARFSAALAAAVAAVAALRVSPARIRNRRPAAALSSSALFAAVFSAFALGASLRNARRMETVDLFRDALDSREAAFSGRVEGEPSVVALKHGGARLSFDLAPRFIEMENDAIPVPDHGLKVRVEWYGPESMGSARPPFPVPRDGEGWLVCGRLREIPSRGPVPRIALGLRGGEGSFARRAPEFDAGALRFALRGVRRAASRALGRGIPADDPGLALVRAMVLGERAELPESVSASFRDSGTIHVFAISGLHVGVIALVLMAALRRFSVPRWPAFAAYAAVLAAYVELTGGRPSAVRALAMAVVAAAAPLAGRRPEPVLALCGALLLLLSCDPLWIVDAGFFFSFLCTAAILALAGPLGERWDALLARPRAATKRLAGRAACRLAATKAGAAAARLRSRAPDWLAELGSSVWRGVRDGAAPSVPVSVAAWLASVPLTAAVFGRVAPVALLCNLAVIPLSFFTIAAALAALAEAALLPAAVCSAVPVNRVAAFLASAMAESARLASSIPGSSFDTAPWPPAAVAAWFAALAVLCAWLRRPRA